MIEIKGRGVTREERGKTERKRERERASLTTVWECGNMKLVVNINDDTCSASACVRGKIERNNRIKSKHCDDKTSPIQVSF